MNLGEALARAREARRLTQAQLAARIGVSGQQVSRWECGVAVPGNRNVTSLAEVLDLDVVSLLTLAAAGPTRRRDEDPAREVLVQRFERVADRLERIADRLEAASPAAAEPDPSAPGWGQECAEFGCHEPGDA